jgi:hypothetical protein
MNIGSIFTQQTRKTLALAALSAILSGLNLPVPSFWPLRFIAPGVFFGLFFAIGNMQKRLWLTYTAISAVIYFGAAYVWMWMSDSDTTAVPHGTLAGGFIAGALGALFLAVLTKTFSDTPVKSSGDGLTTLIGGIGGIALTYLTADANYDYLPLIAGYAVWQIPVGWSLTVSIQKQWPNPPGGSDPRDHDRVKFWGS